MYPRTGSVSTPGLGVEEDWYVFLKLYIVYHCGDILLQGNLYVSQNWFCFYSRIRGRGRLVRFSKALYCISLW